MDHYLPENTLVAVALLAGTLPAIAYAIVKAFGLRSTSRCASTLFFGDHRLDASESSRSLFASWMSVGNVIVGALIVAVTYQYLASWAVVTWVLGFLVLARHAHAIVNEASNCTTIHNFIRVRFASPAIGRITSLLAIVTAAGVIVLELIVGAALLRAAGIPGSPVIVTTIAVVLLASIATIYTRMGGISAVIATDRVQAIGIGVSLLALLGMTFFTPKAELGTTIADALTQMSAQEPEGHQLFALIAFFVGFGAFQLFVLLGDMTTWQRIQLGENPQAVRSAARSTAVSNLVAWSVLLVTGLLLLRWPAEVIRLPDVGGDLSSRVTAQAEPLTSLLVAVGDTAIGPGVSIRME